MKDVAETIFEEVGWHPDEIDYLTDKPKGVRHRAADTTRTEELLDWHPEYNLKDGLRETINWDNYDGFVVEYPPIEEHLEERWGWSRPIYTFLPYVYDGPIPEPDDHRDNTGDSPSTDFDSMEVTVSGRVVENVRDYGPVLNAFEELFATHNDEVALTILGRPVSGFGDRVMERCRDLESDGHG